MAAAAAAAAVPGFSPPARTLAPSEGRHRLVVEIETVRIDQAEQRLAREAALRNGIEQRCSDRIGIDLAARFVAQRVAPPLQADLTWQYLARRLAHPGDLAVEGIERMEMPAQVRRREQRGEKPVLVVRPHHGFAMGIGVLHGRSRISQPVAWMSESEFREQRFG
jgi:hypothetical protein